MYTQAPFLKKNDTVIILATAKQFEKGQLDTAIATLKKWGLKVQLGEHLYKKSGMFAGNDKQRLDDLQKALNNHSIKAIFCARGGYGTSRIIDDIELKPLKKSPKWIVGFSDVCVLHNKLHDKNIQSIHAIMPLLFNQKGSSGSVEKLRSTLFGTLPEYKFRKDILNKKGSISGIVTGGNISILCSMIGTDADINTKNKILFIEEVGEHLYRLDRMMVQLKRSGKLKKLAGLVIGHLSDIENDNPSFGKNAKQIILDAVKEYDYPVAFNFPAGHEAVNMPLILGGKAVLKVTVKESGLKFV